MSLSGASAYLRTDPSSTQVETSYFIEDSPRRCILYNQAKYRNIVYVSKAVYSKRDMALQSYAATRTDVESQYQVKILLRGHTAFIFNFFRGRETISWSEITPVVSRRTFPFLPFCYAEIAFILRHLNWNSTSPQPFPLFHFVSGKEFGIHSFQYILRVVDSSRPLSQVRCMNIHEGVLGIQVEPYDLMVNRSDNRIISIRSTVRPIHLTYVHPSARAKNPAFPSAKRIKWVGSRGDLHSRRFLLSEPMSISSPRRTFKYHAWIFDPIRLHENRIVGTNFHRQYLRKHLERNDIGALLFSEIVGYSFIGSGNRPLRRTRFDLMSFRQNAQRLWSKLRKRKSVFLIALDENCHLALSILLSGKRPTPIVLVNPFWGTFLDLITRIEGVTDEDRSTFLGGSPSKSLLQMCKEYPRPILVIGGDKLPTDLGTRVRQITYAKKSVKTPFGDFSKPLSPKTVKLISDWILEVQ